MGRRKPSLPNAIPSTRLLGKVQNLVERNSVAVHGKEDTHSSLVVDSSKKDVIDSGAGLGHQCSKSSSISRTLGANDTESDCSSDKLLERTGKSSEHKVFEKITEPEKEKDNTKTMFSGRCVGSFVHCGGGGGGGGGGDEGDRFFSGGDGRH